MQSNQERTPAHGFRPKTAKVFFSGRSQAVRLPKDFQFATNEVLIRKEGDDVILSPRPRTRGQRP
mgnify:CR=1 FL=1